jgi:hypothetical protein
LAANGIKVIFDRANKSRLIHIERTPTVTTSSDPAPNPLIPIPDPQDPLPHQDSSFDCHADPAGRTPISANSTWIASTIAMGPLCLLCVFSASLRLCGKRDLTPKDNRGVTGTFYRRDAETQRIRRANTQKAFNRTRGAPPRSAADTPVGLPGGKASHRFPPQQRGRNPAGAAGNPGTPLTFRHTRFCLSARLTDCRPKFALPERRHRENRGKLNNDKELRIWLHRTG